MSLGLLFGALWSSYSENDHDIPDFPKISDKMSIDTFIATITVEK